MPHNFYFRTNDGVGSAAHSGVDVDTTGLLTKDDQGSVLTGRGVSWSSDNQQIITVDATGTITGVAQGSANITVTSEGVIQVVKVTVALAPVASVTISQNNRGVAYDNLGE